MSYAKYLLLSLAIFLSSSYWQTLLRERIGTRGSGRSEEETGKIKPLSWFSLESYLGNSEAQDECCAFLLEHVVYNYLLF